MTQPVFRFAPSPNGRLHLGHAYSALLNAELAERWSGRLLVRIEDIDLQRCRPRYVAGIEEDLAWLGLAWERPVRRQSEHFGEYRAAADRLRGEGLLYPCFCTRREIAEAVARDEAGSGSAWPRDPDGTPLYSGRCRGLTADESARRIAAGEAHAWRLDGTAARARAGALSVDRFDPSGKATRTPARPERWGDAVVVRKDVPTSYHLSVVADDAVQGVTHVVRGRDLDAATDLHRLLQALLGLPSPRYHHHALVADDHGAKLAKSLRSEPLARLREGGATPDEIRRRLGFAARPHRSGPKPG